MTVKNYAAHLEDKERPHTSLGSRVTNASRMLWPPHTEDHTGQEGPLPKTKNLEQERLLVLSSGCWTASVLLCTASRSVLGALGRANSAFTLLLNPGVPALDLMLAFKPIKIKKAVRNTCSMHGRLQVAEGPAPRFSIFLTPESSEGGVITGTWALDPDRTISHGFVLFNFSVFLRSYS